MPDFIVTSPDGQRFKVTAPEGATADDLPDFSGGAKEKPEPSSLVDFFHSFPRGVVSGIISAMSSSGQSEATLQGMEGVPGQEESMGIVEKNVTGKMHEPETTAGRYGASIGEAIGNPASYVGPGGLPLKIGSAALSGAGAQAGEELTGSGVGRLIGGVAGGIPGSVAATGSPRVPNIPPRKAPFVQQLRDRGIEPTAGDVTGNRSVKHWEELGDLPMGGGSASRNKEQVAKQFTRAVNKQMGESAELATPEVIQQATDRIGATFERLAKKLPINYDDTLGEQLIKIVQEAHAEGLPEGTIGRIQALASHVNRGFETKEPVIGFSPRVRISRQQGMHNIYIDGQLENAFGAASDVQRYMETHYPDLIVEKQVPAVMPGKNYQALTRHGAILQRAMDHSDPDISFYGTRIRDALDETLARSATRRGTREGAGLRKSLESLKEARRQWYNKLVISKSVVGPGEAAAEGLVSPAKLRQNLTSSSDAKVAYAAGKGGGLQDLSRAGNAVLTPLKSSGTGERLQASTMTGLARGLAGRVANSPRMQARLKQTRTIPYREAAVPAAVPLVRGGIVGDPLAARDDEDALAQ
jgi:hypothetical protein